MKKIKSIQNILEERELKKQKIGWHFRPLAICPLPSKPMEKLTIIENEKEKEVYRVLWKRKSGNIEVEILGHPKYGVPYGQDILIILFFIIEAKKQNSRKIENKFYSEFCKMFDIDMDDGRRLIDVKMKLERIRNAKYSWKDYSDPERQKELHYLFVDEINISTKKDSEFKGEKQYILLSERFWDEIQKYKIPINMTAVKYFKGRSSYLNFYLWLSYRVAINYFKNKEAILKGERKNLKRDFIPYWGVNGIKNQLGSQITARRNYRIYIKNNLKAVKEIWPKCPVKIKGDALEIEVKDKKEVDVNIDDIKVFGAENSRLRKGKKTIPYKKRIFSDKQIEFLKKHGSEDIKEKLKSGELEYKEGSEEIRNIKKEWNDTKKATW